MKRKSIYLSTHSQINLTGLPEGAYRALVAKVKAATQDFKAKVGKENFPNLAAEWSNRATSLIQEVIFDVFQSHGVDQNVLKYAFYSCGSLAKKQATPYSDFEGFVLWEDPNGDANKQAEVIKIKAALASLHNVFHKLFEDEKQFYPDPILTPLVCCGTPDEVKSLLEEGPLPLDIVLVNIATARSLTACSENFLEQLTVKLAETQLDEEKTLNDLYKHVVEDFSGPVDQESVDIKRDLLRPLDFLAMAFRKEFNIGIAEDGTNLRLFETLQDLVSAGHLTRELSDFIVSIFIDTYKLRVEQHLHHGKEHDTLKLDTLDPTTKNRVEELVDKVAILRGIAKQRYEFIKAGVDTSQMSIALPSVTAYPYVCRDVPIKNIKFDLSPYVFCSPAREFFESNRSLLSYNLTDHYLKSEGADEKIFNNLDTPKHLMFLIETLDQVIKNDHPLDIWIGVVFQNALSDLFGKDGKFHPWFIKMANNIDEEVLDSEDYKKTLLAAYVNQLVSTMSANSEQLKQMPREQQTKALQALNNVVAKDVSLIRNSTMPVHKIMNDRERYYAGALIGLAEVVKDSIQLLQDIKKDTVNVNLQAVISHKINEYNQLRTDIQTVAEKADTNGTKREFFYKASTHFQKDLEKLEKQVSGYKLNFYESFKQRFINLTKRLNAWLRNTELSTVSSFLNDTKKFTSFFAVKAAVSNELEPEGVVNKNETISSRSQAAG